MSSASTNIISASASLAIFSILTCVYFLLRYLFVDGYKKNNSTLSYLFTGFYIILFALAMDKFIFSRIADALC